MRNWHRQVVLGLAVVATVVSLWMTPRESPVDRATRLCEPCGLDGKEVIWLIVGIRTSHLSPREAIKHWEDLAGTDGLDEAWTMCGPCVNAIVDAAER